MARVAFTDPEVVERSKQFVNVYVDVDKAQELSQQYDISSIPTLVHLSPSGEELNRLTAPSAEELVQAMEQTVGRTGGTG